MAYTLSNLLIDLLGGLGQSTTFLATGGSTTTIINTTIAERRGKKPINNYAVDWYAFVVRDAGGAGAAPEGEFQRINAYDSGSQTYTVDTPFSSAIGAGDEIMIVSSRFFAREAIRRTNEAVQKLVIALPDITLTTTAGQQVYSLPVTAKRERPRQIWIQQTAGDDDTYVQRFDYDYVPSAGGSAGSLKFTGPLKTGMTIRIYYDTYQPALTAYNSVIHETIDPKLALAAAKVSLLEWYVAKTRDKDFWAQDLNIARNDFDEAKKMYPIYKPKRGQRYFTPPC